ncbi:MAG TPA: cytochrome o ubiquinol oxidase subunit IV [Candidatus Saccharimonadales bacterium]
MAKQIVRYGVGFGLAVATTLLAYWFVVGHVFTGGWLVAAIMLLAVLQLAIQMVFFLHLGSGREARWNVVSFFFMTLILVVIVAGSLWIMYNLNYNMMTMNQSQKDGYMKQQSNSGGF